MRADDNGIYMSDTPQDWSERWLSLGSFSFCVELPVSIRYEFDGRTKVWLRREGLHGLVGPLREKESANASEKPVCCCKESSCN